MKGLFICLERALDTTKKRNLQALLDERLVLFEGFGTLAVTPGVCYIKCHGTFF